MHHDFDIKLSVGSETVHLGIPSITSKQLQRCGAQPAQLCLTTRLSADWCLRFSDFIVLLRTRNSTASLASLFDMREHSV